MEHDAPLVPDRSQLEACADQTSASSTAVLARIVLCIVRALRSGATVHGAIMINIQQEPTVIAIYAAYASAETAIRKLQQSKLDLSRVSLIGKGPPSERQAFGFYVAGEQASRFPIL